MEAGDYEDFDQKIRVLKMMYRKIKKNPIDLISYQLLVNMFTGNTENINGKLNSVYILFTAIQNKKDRNNIKNLYFSFHFHSQLYFQVCQMKTANTNVLPSRWNYN